MTEPFATGPLVGHIPGSGINFTFVGAVHVITSDQIGPGLSRSVLPGIRRAAPERLVPILLDGLANDRVTVGDLLVTLSASAQSVRLGRPMQVLHRDADGMTVALDDSDLPRSMNVGEASSSGIGNGEMVAAWQVLAAFGISRCPRCQSPGQQLIYGLPAGGPSPGYVLAGCLIPSLNTDLVCPRCHAEWALPALPDTYDEDDTYDDDEYGEDVEPIESLSDQSSTSMPSDSTAQTVGTSTPATVRWYS